MTSLSTANVPVLSHPNDPHPPFIIGPLGKGQRDNASRTASIKGTGENTGGIRDEGWEMNADIMNMKFLSVPLKHSTSYPD